MLFVVIVAPRRAVRHIKPAFGARYCDIELSRILRQHRGIVLTEEVWDSSFYRVEYYHVVKLQSLRLMNGRHEDALLQTCTVAEVGFLERIYLHHIPSELFGKRRI